MKNTFVGFVVLFLLSFVVLGPAATLTVTNIVDSGDGTLRQAILDANADVSPDHVTIGFNIPGTGVHTLTPLTGLPTITRPVTIDGYTQPGASPNTLADADNAVLRVELSGGSLGAPTYGLRLASGGCTVSGLVINTFTNGTAILVEVAGSNVIEGNFIGTDASGTNALANVSGIGISGAGGNRVGGLTPASRNIIGGNNYVGISLSGVSNQVLGNFVGVGADGMTSLPNGGWGMYLQNGFQTQIGGPAPGARNVISGTPNGCWVNGGGSNVIQGNFIGTDASGAVSRGNGSGIVLDSSNDNIIGGTEVGTGNLISGNGTGVVVEGVGSSNNVVAGNLIGTDATGTTALGNANAGVSFYGASGNLLGGTNAGAGNVISGNDGVGVYVSPAGATNNAVLGNRFFANGSLGIDLYPGGGGVTPNDTGDDDDGPNHLQNFPEITSAALIGGNLALSYRVDSGVANSAYPLTVEFFLADSVASGEGRTLLHRHTYDTPQAFTNITFTPAATVKPGDPIVATATDATGNTSEFSAAATATSNLRPVVVNPIPDQSGMYGVPFSYTFPTNTFNDPDAGDTLSYTASGLPSGITFDDATRTFSGTPAAAGTFGVSVTATDNGTPALSSNAVFNFSVESALIVTNLADSGPGTLRQVIADAVSGDTILFAVTGTITLETPLQPLDVNKPLNILGPGPTNLTIRVGGVFSRIFNVTAGPTKISGLTLQDGNTDNFNITAPEGGAIRNTTQLTLDTCSITGNTALGYGGAIYSIGVSAQLIAINCTFARNTAGFAYNFDEAGGAIWSDGILRLTNCTFSGNYAAQIGGAIYSKGTAEIASCTITRNVTYWFSGDTRGGGIDNDGGTLTLLNSIVAGNTNQNAPDAQDIGGLISGGDYNLINYTNNLAVSGTHNVLGRDPLLSPLQNLGGPTRTHGLASTSPALDVANAVTSPATDQRGVARPQGAGHDIGAFEGALPLNHAPVVADPIPDQNSAYQALFNYTLPANTFSDSDGNQSLTYAASGLPDYLSFDPATRVIAGTLYTAGRFTVTVTVTDDGAPPLSTGTTFDIMIPRLPVTGRADDQTRYYGDPDPFFTITYYGLTQGDGPFVINNPPSTTTTATPVSPSGSYPIVLSGGSDDVYDLVGLTNGVLIVTPAPLIVTVDSVIRRIGRTNPPFTAFTSGIRNGDNIPPTLTTTATPASPVGEYPITATLNDPDGKLTNYTVTLSPGTLAVVDFDVDYRVLRPFGFTNQMARSPSSRLIEGTNNWLYGTTPFGGVNDLGTVYRVRLDGSNFTVLHHFSGTISGTNDDGRRGWAGVTLASDGVLYGVTTRGGFTNNGTLYKLNLDGSGYAVLRRFGQTAGDGTVPTSPLIEGRDGALYGTSYFGGSSNVGTVFRINKDGSGYAILHSFIGTDGYFPEAGIIEGQDGMLYGTTVDGADGQLLTGSVFKLAKDGTGFAMIAVAGASRSPLLQGSDGLLYGVTDTGGSANSGALFTVNTNGTGFAVLHNFASTPGDGGFISGYAPIVGPLIEGTNGDLYGVTHLGGSGSGGVMFAVNKNGSNYRILRSFVGNSADGVEPMAGLFQAHDGVVYGTANSGGTASAGTGFKINADGTGYATLWNFIGTGGDITNPGFGLIEGTNGVLYGAAGTSLFKVNKDGTGYEIIYTANPADGIAYPRALIAGTDGALYGLARGGFVFINGGYVSFSDRFFRVNQDGSGYTNLHSFTFSEGTFDFSASLIESSNGVFYGTAATGGDLFEGALFRVNKDGSGFTVLRSFTGVTGSTPQNVMEGSDGRLYGILNYGGDFSGGAMFAINTNGSGYTNLHVFGGTNTDGTYPVGRLIFGSNGRLYGVSSGGGTFGGGTLFAIDKLGTGYSVLRSLGATPTDARVPSGLTDGGDGYLYGTSVDGGKSEGGFDTGTIFRLREDGSGYAVLHRFYGSTADGFNPAGWLLHGSDDAFYGVSENGGTTTFGTVYRMFLNHLPPNLSPVLEHPIADQNGAYGLSFSFTFAANTFSDPDAGQMLSYTAGGLPPGIIFTLATRTFSGTPTNTGPYTVTLTATDNGTLSLSANGTFNIVVAKAPLTVTANNTNRPFGQVNPPLTGTLVGVTNSDNFTATFATAATPSSPPGDYPITPILQDPDSRLGNYHITTNTGTLTVDGVTLRFGSAAGSLTFCWPTTAAAFLLEYTDDLALPVIWHEVTSGIITNGPNICLTVTPEATVSTRFYRLRLP